MAKFAIPVRAYSSVEINVHLSEEELAEIEYIIDRCDCPNWDLLCKLLPEKTLEKLRKATFKQNPTFDNFEISINQTVYFEW